MLKIDVVRRELKKHFDYDTFEVLDEFITAFRYLNLCFDIDYNRLIEIITNYDSNIELEKAIKDFKRQGKIKNKVVDYASYEM